mmetsp:Transcript_20119/g.50061  ORF Transcript_20119/g.50061 Transcript_20119/m.50061 type:complete len:108 (-) Transcript_20119:545-868(-)
MTSINRARSPMGPQDPVHLARTLRRIKRRLLLEQCGAPLPRTLQNTPRRLARPLGGSAMPYALQSKPQALFRSDSGDSNESTIGSNSKLQPSRVVFSQITIASPSME